MSLDAFSDVNYLAVLVGGVAYFAIGALWYSPALFAKPWMAAAGVDPQGGMNAVLFLGTFVLELVAALGLGLLAVWTGASSVGDGLLLGLTAGVAFSLTSLIVTFAYENRKPVLHLINGGYHVVALAVVGIIVSVWS
ncbi:MAG: DUF1761 domain-containing protein [Actinobacteria bacterium]|nr:DUF1761 domain-containing protein [Actinomycetota bacterium]